eukprot:768147-Prymnesium_polylepis.1
MRPGGGRTEAGDAEALELITNDRSYSRHGQAAVPAALSRWSALSLVARLLYGDPDSSGGNVVFS